MKKLSLSLMLNVSLALMLTLSLIYPQSVAVNFVAAWAILETVICVVAGGVGVYATEYVLERYGRRLWWLWWRRLSRWSLSGGFLPR